MNLTADSQPNIPNSVRSEYLLKGVLRILTGDLFHSRVHGVISFAQILSDKSNHITEQERIEFSELILTCAQSLLKLSTRLDLWNSLYVAQTPQHSYFTISTERIVEIIENTASDNPSTINAFIVKGKNQDQYQLIGDENIFSTIICESVTNALQHSVPGRLPEISIQQSDNCYLYISIQNRSSFATIEQLQTYQPFAQLSRKMRKMHAQKGIGLGLEITRLAIAKIGGRIEWHNGSEEGIVELRLFFRMFTHQDKEAKQTTG